MKRFTEPLSAEELEYLQVNRSKLHTWCSSLLHLIKTIKMKLSSTPSPREKNILLVGDLSHNAHTTLKAVLAEHGFCLVNMKSRVEALKEMLKQPFTFILIEIFGITQSEVDEWISNAKARCIPILFIEEWEQKRPDFREFYHPC